MRRLRDDQRDFSESLYDWLACINCSMLPEREPLAVCRNGHVICSDCNISPWETSCQSCPYTRHNYDGITALVLRLVQHDWKSGQEPHHGVEHDGYWGQEPHHGIERDGCWGQRSHHGARAWGGNR